MPVQKLIDQVRETDLTQLDKLDTKTADIIKLYNEGYTLTFIAEKYGKSYQTIQGNIKTGLAQLEQIDLPPQEIINLPAADPEEPLDISNRFTAENRPFQTGNSKGVQNRITVINNILNSSVVGGAIQYNNGKPYGTELTVWEKIILKASGKALEGDMPAIKHIIEQAIGKPVIQQSVNIGQQAPMFLRSDTPIPIKTIDKALDTNDNESLPVITEYQTDTDDCDNEK